MSEDLKPLRWIASTQKDLCEFPSEVRRVMGFALDQAQRGGKHPDAKPLKGFGGGGVLEIVDDYDGDTYRAVYTVNFGGVIYALHAFQKKSKSGIATPKQEIDLIKSRLLLAQEDHKKLKQNEAKNQKGRKR
jgi:phage-related protein